MIMYHFLHVFLTGNQINNKHDYIQKHDNIQVADLVNPI